MQRLAWFLAVCIASAIPIRALAQEEAAVLGITSQEGDDALAARITHGLRVAVNHVRGWHLREGDVLLAQMRLAHDCPEVGPEAACMMMIAGALHVRHIVYGVLRHDEETPGGFALTLSWFDRESASIAGMAYARIAAGDASDFSDLARSWLMQMDILTPERRSSPHVLRWTGAGLLALGAAAFVATVGSWVRLGDIESDEAYMAYRGRVPPGTADVCAEAAAGNGWSSGEARVRALCDDAATFEVMQWVFLSTAAVLTGVGTAFLLVDHGMEGVSLTPSVGADRAAFMVTARF